MRRVGLIESKDCDIQKRDVLGRSAPSLLFTLCGAADQVVREDHVWWQQHPQGLIDYCFVFLMLPC